MKILVDAVGIRGHGGASVLRELYRYLAEARPDWTWHWLLLDRSLRDFDDPGPTKGVALEHTRRGNSGLGRMAWVRFSLPKIVKSVRPDVVLSFANIGMPMSPVPSVVFVHQSNILRRVSSAGGTYAAALRYRILRRSVLKGLQHSSAVIVQTDSMRRGLEEMSPGIAGSVRVIPSGCSIIARNHAVSDKMEIMLKTLQGCPFVSYVAYPHEHKNHVRLLQAWGKVQLQVPTARLVLTVEEAPGDAARFARATRMLHDTAMGLGITDSIVWAGDLEPEEVFLLLKNSTMLVFPSLAESFGLPLAEAICTDCPVAAADLPYAHEVAGEAAIYFDPLRADSISDAIVLLLQDQGLRGRLGRKREALKRRYDYRTIAEEFASTLESVR